jgi:hypothetical protein
MKSTPANSKARRTARSLAAVTEEESRPGDSAGRIVAALDERLVLRHFPQLTPPQHSQEPCDWQTRWQMSSPSSRRPIPHGGLSQGYPIVFSWAHWQFGRGLLSRGSRRFGRYGSVWGRVNFDQLRFYLCFAR